MKYKVIAGILFFLLFIVINFPRERTLIPEWRILVVNRSGSPVPNCRMRQFWSPGRGEREVNSTTDSDGIVVFPAQIVRQPLLFQVIYNLSEQIEYYVMPHGASIGSYAYIIPVCGTSSHHLRYEEGGVLEHKLILRS
ncbi:MAG: hypothetical protein M3384_13510 [Acidobacteriota bacterium]|nr:hypothetical protein [Acidobacteriota bacterium]